MAYEISACLVGSYMCIRYRSRGFEKIFGKTDRCQIFLMDKARSFPYDEGRKDGMPMEIGAKLRQARIAAGLTQEQTAEALGVSRQSISNWENEKNYPDIVSVVRLSDLYAANLDALLKAEAPVSDSLAYLAECTPTVGRRSAPAPLIHL